MMTTDWKETIKTIGLEVGTPVVGKIKIEAPSDEVWKVIAEPGNLKKCHPFCAKTEVVKWPGSDSIDTITYYSGIMYKRNFINWQKGVGYDIELGESPSLTARVLWRIFPDSSHSCDFSIEVFPYLKSDLPDEKKCAYQARLFGDTLEHYLDCVVKGVRYKVVTGKDVIKDQFGFNAHYSG